MLLDQLLRLGGSIPVAPEETAAIDTLLELIETVDGVRIGFTSRQRFLEEASLRFLEHIHHLSRDRLDRQRFLVTAMAEGEHDLTSLQIPRTDLDANRYTLQFPLIELESRSELLPIVEMGSGPCCLESLFHDGTGLDHGGPLFAALVDGHDNGLDGSESRWQNQALIITMGHHQCADEPGRNSP